MSRQTYPRRKPVAVVIAGIVSACLACTSPVAAQRNTADSSPAAPPGWEFDYDLFVTLLEAHSLKSRNDAVRSAREGSWNSLFNDPSQSVMVLTGSISSDIGWQTVHRFLSRGGVILIATDQRFSVHGFFHINSGPVTTRNRHDAWLSKMDCLEVTKLNPSTPLTENVTSIVTNRTGWIDELERPLDYRWTPLAQLPADLEPQDSNRQLLAAMATSRSESRGRMLVFADNSPLTNGMLWHGNNLALLINVVDELTRDQRTEYVFLHNGRPVRSRVTELLVEEALRRQQEPPPIPPEALADLPAETLLEIGNAVATSIEDSDILNELATDRPRSMPARFYRRSILLALCIAAGAIFLLRGWLAGQTTLPWKRKPRPPETTEAPASLAAMPYDRACQALARDTCRLMTESQDTEVWQAQLSPHGQLWSQLYARSEAPRHTAEVLTRLLTRATQTSEFQISRHEFEQFGAAIYDLKQLHTSLESTETRLAWT